MPVYSGLSRRPAGTARVERYSGRWNGRDVSFDRVFRGRRFTDEECQALCDGELIEIHNINGNGLVYGVSGGLKESALGVVFKTVDTLLNNPDYNFSNRQRRYMDNRRTVNADSESSIDLPDGADLVLGVLDEFSDDDDSRIAAVIAGDLMQDMPEIRRTDYIVGEKLPVYVPVIRGVGTFTADGFVPEPEVESEPEVDSNPDDDEYTGPTFEFVGAFDDDEPEQDDDSYEQETVAERESDSRKPESDFIPEDTMDPSGLVDTSYLEDPLADPDSEELDWDDGWEDESAE